MTGVCWVLQIDGNDPGLIGNYDPDGKYLEEPKGGYWVSENRLELFIFNEHTLGEFQCYTGYFALILATRERGRLKKN